MSQLEVVPGCADIDNPHRGATSAGHISEHFYYTFAIDFSFAGLPWIAFYIFGI